MFVWSPQRLHLNALAYLVLIGPIAVLLSSDSFLFHLFKNFVRPDLLLAGVPNGSIMSRALVDLAGANTLLLFACVGIFVGFAFASALRLTVATNLWLGAVGLISWIFAYRELSSSSQPRSWKILGSPPQPCPTGSTGNCGIGLVEYLLDVSTPFLVAAGVAAILGTIASLASSPKGQSPDEWKQQRKSADTWLFISSGLLVAGLLFHQSWGRWLAANWALAENKEFTALIASYTAFKGVQYSALIASYYIPVVVILTARAEEIAQRWAKDNYWGGDIAQYRERLGMTVHLSSLLKAVFGVLAPFLASLLGPAADLLKSIGS